MRAELPNLPPGFRMNKPPVRKPQVILLGRGNLLFHREHPLVALPQQRFRLPILLLSCKAGPQYARREEPVEVLRLYFLLRLQSPTSQRLSLRAKKRGSYRPRNS
jgi:hypothetical protein